MYENMTTAEFFDNFEKFAAQRKNRKILRAVKAFIGFCAIREKILSQYVEEGDFDESVI